jgi:hypothetical protein
MVLPINESCRPWSGQHAKLSKQLTVLRVLPLLPFSLEPYLNTLKTNAKNAKINIKGLI